MRADGVSFGSELLYPLVHDLSIAKCAEPAEEFARNFAHCRPGWIGVHFSHRGRDGAAAANGHAQIMDGVRVGGRADVFQLLDDAVHPKGQEITSHYEMTGRLERGPRACYFGIDIPEWRNWQTRWTQNPVVLSTVWVRPPPPGPRLAH